MSVNGTSIYVDKNGSAVFPEGIEEIKSFALYGEKSLKSVALPDTVKKIGMYAFCGCENLQELILPQGLEFIGRRAFEGCKKLKSFVMPDSVTEIEENVFRDVDFDKPVYNRDKTILYVYKRTGCGDDITLPETVKRIFSGAFTGNMFNNTVLHYGLEQIDSDAFFNCILCKKLTIHCPADKIKNGAFWNFRPVPEFIFVQEDSDYSTLLRICGASMIKRVDRLDIPMIALSERSKLESLVSECSVDEPETIIKVAEFFSECGKEEFFDAAANFWYYRAKICGSEKASEILKEKCNREKRQLPSVARPEIRNESGERLYALGFNFFDKKRDYCVSLPDKNSIVEVTADAGSDGPDEDGFGREEYYDWWYLDENLKRIPCVSGILGYSNHDRRINEEKFKKLYDYAVMFVGQAKAVKAYKKRMKKLVEEYKK